MNRYQAASKAIDALPILAIALFFGVFIFKSLWTTVGIVAVVYFSSWVFLKLTRLSVDLQLKGDCIELTKHLEKLGKRTTEHTVMENITITNKGTLKKAPAKKTTPKSTKTVAQKRPTSRSHKTA